MLTGKYETKSSLKQIQREEREKGRRPRLGRRSGEETGREEHKHRIEFEIY